MVKRRNKLPAMRYPMVTEQKYRSELKRVVRQLRFLCVKHLHPYLEGWIEGSDHTQPLRADADDWHAELNEQLKRILQGMKAPTKAAIESTDGYADAVDSNNRRDWQRIVRAAYGVNPTKHDQKRYDALIKDWSKANADLITNIPVKATNQIRADVVASLQTGTTVSDLQDVIQERIDVSDSRAELIARDQIGKLNGDLTRERHAEAGVTQYVWQTMGDERVRDSHADCDGKTFTWGEPPADPGCEPGEDFQCRCWAEPILPDQMGFELTLQDAA